MPCFLSFCYLTTARIGISWHIILNQNISWSICWYTQHRKMELLGIPVYISTSLTDWLAFVAVVHDAYFNDWRSNVFKWCGSRETRRSGIRRNRGRRKQSRSINGYTLLTMKSSTGSFYIYIYIRHQLKTSSIALLHLLQASRDGLVGMDTDSPSPPGYVGWWW